MASKETINFPRDTTLARIANGMEALIAIEAHQYGNITDWYTFQTLIREGMGEAEYPVGTKLGITHEVYGSFNFIVGAHNHYLDPHGHNAYSVLLVSEICVVNSLQYDNTEAAVYAESLIAAGTYNLTLPAGYDEANGGGKSYSFTLTKDVPAGGVIMFPWAYNTNASTTKVSTYESRTATTAIESGIAVEEGANGTSLGTLDGATSNLNHAHRVRYGSNNWRESAMRQFLNSAADAGSVWTPQTIFDRPPTWAANTAGWMKGLPADFLAVVGEVDISTKSNNIFEVNDPLTSSYITRDKFFLLSRDEIGFGKEGSIADGSVIELYADATNADRIKRNNAGTARYWWLRSPYPGNAINVRSVSTDGSLSRNYALTANGVAPACVIY